MKASNAAAVGWVSSIIVGVLNSAAIINNLGVFPNFFEVRGVWLFRIGAR